MLANAALTILQLYIIDVNLKILSFEIDAVRHLRPGALGIKQLATILHYINLN